MIKKKDLKFSLRSIKQLSSYLNSTETFSISEFDKKNVGYGKGFRIDFRNETGLFKLDIIIDFLYNGNKSDKEQFKLFGTHIVLEFEFKDYKGIVNLNENKDIDIPPVLLQNLISIAYSTARGVLFSISQKTEYDELILPLTDPKEFSNIFSGNDDDK
jgi:hypothetical protein